MRIAVVFLTLFSTTAGLFAQSVAPQTTLQTGIEAFRAGDYQVAAPSLYAAANGFLSNEEMEKYVSSGQFETLASVETALIYLAIAQARLGNEAAARDAIARLMIAERIAPTYAGLKLDADAAEFEALTARLVPGSTLPKNASFLVAATTASPVAPPAAPPRASPAPVPEPVTVQVEAPPSDAGTERERYIEQRLAEERVKIERMFEERLAVERTAMQREADVRVAAVQRTVLAPVAMPDLVTRRDYLARLREAEGFVATRQFGRAIDHWSALMRRPGTPRDILAEAATGLYRAGAYRQAVDAFAQFGTFGRGEEDLRYYYAVALFEVGRFDEAGRELSCALPYIEVTNEVERYQAKIGAAVRG
ncbi:MAG TPA: hypothetical protein VMS98_18735 [Thermoanaerobaculia bacterium]|nr:hypothetical protein [Thermoanaerobaculia bacterium]